MKTLSEQDSFLVFAIPFKTWVHDYLASSLGKMKLNRLQKFLETETFYDTTSTDYKATEEQKETQFNADLLKKIPAETVKQLNLQAMNENATLVVKWCFRYLTTEQLSAMPKDVIRQFLNSQNCDFLKKKENAPVIQKWLEKDVLEMGIHLYWIAEEVFQEIDVTQIDQKVLDRLWNENQKVFSEDVCRALFKAGKLRGEVAKSALKKQYIKDKDFESVLESQIEALLIDIKMKDYFPEIELFKKLLNHNKISAKLWEKWVTDFSLNPSKNLFRQYVSQIDFCEFQDEQLKKCFAAKLEQRCDVRHFIRLLPQNQVQSLLERNCISSEAASAIPTEIFENLDFSKIQAPQLNILLSGIIDRQGAFLFVTRKQFEVLKSIDNDLSKMINELIDYRRKQEELDVSATNENLIFNWLTDKQLLQIDYSKWDYKRLEAAFRKKKRYWDDNGDRCISQSWDKEKLEIVLSNKEKIEQIGSVEKCHFEIRGLFQIVSENVVKSVDLNKFYRVNVKYFFDAQKEKNSQEQLQVFYDKGVYPNWLDKNDYDWLAKNRPQLIQGLKINFEDQFKLQNNKGSAFFGSEQAQKVYVNRNNK